MGLYLASDRCWDFATVICIDEIGLLMEISVDNERL